MFKKKRFFTTDINAQNNGQIEEVSAIEEDLITSLSRFVSELQAAQVGYAIRNDFLTPFQRLERKCSGLPWKASLRALMRRISIVAINIYAMLTFHPSLIVIREYLEII